MFWLSRADHACLFVCGAYSTQVFGFEVPAELPGVPGKVLNPREAWSDKKGYDATRTKLAGMFKENFSKFVKVRLPGLAWLGLAWLSSGVSFVRSFIRHCFSSSSCEEDESAKMPCCCFVFLCFGAS